MNIWIYGLKLVPSYVRNQFIHFLEDPTDDSFCLDIEDLPKLLEELHSYEIYLTSHYKQLILEFISY